MKLNSVLSGTTCLRLQPRSNAMFQISLLNISNFSKHEYVKHEKYLTTITSGETDKQIVGWGVGVLLEIRLETVSA